MKTVTGKVISNKMQNTIVVSVGTFWQHPVYKKRIKRSTNYHAHTDKKIAEGSKVKITQIKPISKTVCWKVVEVI